MSPWSHANVTMKLSVQAQSNQHYPHSSEATTPSPAGSNPHLGSVRMSITHFRWGATVVQFWARATMAPASKSP